MVATVKLVQLQSTLEADRTVLGRGQGRWEEIRRRWGVVWGGKKVTSEVK